MSEGKDLAGIDRGDDLSGTSPARQLRAVVATAAVVSALVAVAATLAVEGALGHLRSGTVTATAPDGLMDLEGHISGVGQGEVYYPAPFAAPPNLVIEGGNQLQVTEQRKDGFKYHSPFLTTSFTWRARGARPSRGG